MPDFGLNRRRFVQAAGATGLAAAFPTTAGATPAQAALADDLDLDGGAQEVLVVFDSNDHVAQLERFSLPEGYHRFEVLPIGYTIATGDQLREIAALQSVRHVQPNREAEFHNAEAREKTNVSTVQSTGFTGENAHVAVIDSGLSGLHPDHRGNVKHNYKYQNPLQRDTTWRDVKPGDTDDNGHGSHVSGTVAGNGTFSETSPAQGQNQKGMAPDATLTVYSTGVTLAVLNFIAAFDHILANHTKETAESEDEVIHLTNNSYGPTSGNGADFNPDAATNVATYKCYEAGVLSFFSAGNSGPGSNTYSRYAKAPWVVGVAATDDTKKLAGFSSRGRKNGYDGITNRDRDLALSNVKAHYAAQGDSAIAQEESVQTDSFSGGPAAGAVVVGLNQTTGSFTAQSGDPSFDPQQYEVRATLTWSPANPEGPEPNDLDFDLLDSSGEVVESSGTGGSETQDKPEETLTGTVTPGSEYSFQVTGWRGAANWEISFEVFAVQFKESTTDPGRPYGVYNPDLGATGVSIVSTMSPNDPLQGLDNGTNTSLASPYYAAISGTSMSSPTATGATALVIDAYVEEYGEAPDPETLFELLEGPGTVFLDGSDGTADKKYQKFQIGNGFIDVSFATDIRTAVENLRNTEDDGDGGDDGSDGGDDGSDDDGDDTEDDGDNDENGEGDDNQDENGDEKEENGDEGGDNGEGDNDDEGGQGGNDVSTVSTSYGF